LQTVNYIQQEDKLRTITIKPYTNYSALLSNPFCKAASSSKDYVVGLHN